jgi:hypothetical protein
VCRTAAPERKQNAEVKDWSDLDDLFPTRRPPEVVAAPILQDRPLEKQTSQYSSRVYLIGFLAGVAVALPAVAVNAETSGELLRLVPLALLAGLFVGMVALLFWAPFAAPFQAWLARGRPRTVEIEETVRFLSSDECASDPTRSDGPQEVTKDPLAIQTRLSPPPPSPSPTPDAIQKEPPDAIHPAP